MQSASATGTRQRYGQAAGPITHLPGPLVSSVLLVVALLCSHGRAEPSDGHTDEHARHTVGLFLGSTSQDRRSQQRRSGATVGLEYEYRINAGVGLGATAEYARGDFDTTVLVAPVAYHAKRWKLYAGPGIELSGEGSEPLLRIGAEYAFEVGEFELSPQVDLDFVNGERLFIFGVVFAHPF